MLRELNTNEMELVSGGNGTPPPPPPDDEVIVNGVRTGGRAYPSSAGFAIADISSQNSFDLMQSIQSMNRGLNGAGGTDVAALEVPECTAARQEHSAALLANAQALADATASAGASGNLPSPSPFELLMANNRRVRINNAAAAVNEHCS